MFLFVSVMEGSRGRQRLDKVTTIASAPREWEEKRRNNLGESSQTRTYVLVVDVQVEMPPLSLPSLPFFEGHHC